MAFDGNGNWISNFSAVADRDANIKILASRFDGIFIADIASSFENCLTKDGQVKTQTNFNANNYRVINVANPTGDKDAVNLQTLNSKDSTAVHKTGNETIAGTKTFSSTISGSITGNAGTVTNGVYTAGNQTIAGTKTFSSTIHGSINGNAGTVTNGVYTTGNQTIGGTKTFSNTITGNISGNAGTVTNGVYTTGNQTIPGNKTFTGTTKAPTPSSATDNTTNVATTQWVNNHLANSSVKKSMVGFGIPDYSSATTITSPYTPSKHGIIIAQSTASYSTCEIKVGSLVISRNNSGDSGTTTNTVWAIVESGKQYTITATGTGVMTFVPFYGG